MEGIKATQRQVQIIQMAANDKRQAEIASILKISRRSVESEVKKIRESSPVKSLPAICVLFYKNGWIT